jgi:hypothetical protein
MKFNDWFRKKYGIPETLKAADEKFTWPELVALESMRRGRV